MNNIYRFMVPNSKRLKEFIMEKNMVPDVGDCVIIDDINYRVLKVDNVYNYDRLNKTHIIYLDNIEEVKLHLVY